jgi:hypothetical protein
MNLVKFILIDVQSKDDFIPQQDNYCTTSLCTAYTIQTIHYNTTCYYYYYLAARSKLSNFLARICKLRSNLLARPNGAAEDEGIAIDEEEVDDGKGWAAADLDCRCRSSMPSNSSVSMDDMDAFARSRTEDKASMLLRSLEGDRERDRDRDRDRSEALMTTEIGGAGRELLMLVRKPPSLLVSISLALPRSLDCFSLCCCDGGGEGGDCKSAIKSSITIPACRLGKKYDFSLVALVE